MPRSTMSRKQGAVVWLWVAATCLIGMPGSATAEPDFAAPGESYGTSTDDVPGVPAPFLANPFADEFVMAGTQTTSVPDHYFPSNGDGTFGARSDIAGLGRVMGVDVADMDNDGDNDFVLCDGIPGEVYLYTNDEAGQFTPTLVASEITGSEWCTNLRVADFNHDGRPDFVVGDNKNSMGTKSFLQEPGGTFTVSEVLDTSWTDAGMNVLFGIAAGDVDGDGHADIVMLGYKFEGQGQVRFYAGDGTGGFATSTLLFDLEADFGAQKTTGLACIDIEGDGDLDIIAGGGDAGVHYLYINDGAGAFDQPAGPEFVLESFTGLDDWDADGDGDDDLMIVTWNPASELYFAENLGGFLAPPVIVGSVSGSSIGVGAPERAHTPPKTPAVSKPGLLVITLLLLTTSSVYLCRRRSSTVS